MNYQQTLEKFENMSPYKRGCHFKDVPEEFKTYELCKLCIGRRGFEHIPEQHKDYDMYKLFLKSHVFEKEMNEAWQIIPEEFKTREMYQILVGKQPSFLKITPIEFIDQEMCNKAVVKPNLRLSEIIMYIPDEFKTHDLFKASIGVQSVNFLSVPQEYRDDEMCRLAMERRKYEVKEETTEDIMYIVGEDTYQECLEYKKFTGQICSDESSDED